MAGASGSTGQERARAEAQSDAVALGVRGERLAAAYLEGQGWTVLDRNWRCRNGELDLVAMDGDEIVFVEVKTRRGTGFGMPGEAVTNQKAQRIRRLASLWLTARREVWSYVRFDVIGIVVPITGDASLEHYEGAF
ncbi:YraN family protein [Tomitella biformata]|uniref:YraN family protein n=1 Tax=Tomitella biformata TaxID=630403 RepID=UPI000467D8B6|nr:YraN family protein [Tomitella biformata]